MGITRTIKLDYFTVSYYESGTFPSKNDKPFDLCALIAKIDGSSLEDRMFEYYQEKARLDKFSYNSSGNYWFLNFTRLRETNIPSKARISKISEAIKLDPDEFISEECNAIFDCNLAVLMLQRNIHSLSPSGINEYLNKLWGNNSIRIYLRPIPSKSLIEKAKKAQVYRRLNVRFANINEEKFDGSQKSPLKRIYQNCKVFNGVNAEIVISMGDERKASLSNETVSETLKDIQKNKGLLSKAVISIKETDDSKVEVIDLFEENLCDYINVVLEKRVSLASEFVESKMVETLENRKGDLYEIVGGIK